MGELVLDRLTKQFRDGAEQVVAVDEVSIDIEDGEFLVLVGPSGCGKSTTLRCIAGLERPTSGEIRLDGRSIGVVPAQRRDVAMVFQSYALYPHMTVRGNMSFGLEESTDLSDDEIERRVEDVAETMGIGNLLDRKPSELSGGQQQRVALGRAIVREPEVFLMDEPLSNLDAKLRGQMRTELQRLQSDLDVTTVYVTHDQTEAMTMGDRIAILDGGELQQVGTPLECYHRPNNLFVAGFVGDPPMNFLDVTHDGDGTLESEAFGYSVSRDVAEKLPANEPLILGVRPEDVVIDGAETDPGHSVDATIDVVEPMGDENVVYLAVGEEGGVGEPGTTIVATVGGMQAHDAGDEVSVFLPEDAIHVFHAETEDALHTRRLETAEEEVPEV